MTYCSEKLNATKNATSYKQQTKLKTFFISRILSVKGFEGGVVNPLVALGGPLPVAVGLLKRLVSKGEEGVAAGASGVRLPPVDVGFASLAGAAGVISRASSEETSMLS